MAGIIVDVVNGLGAVGFFHALTGVVDDIAGGDACTGGGEHAATAIVGEAGAAIVGEVACGVVSVGLGEAAGDAGEAIAGGLRGVGAGGGGADLAGEAVAVGVVGEALGLGDVGDVVAVVDVAIETQQAASVVVGKAAVAGGDITSMHSTLSA
jgi:hypothetical protein